MFCKYIWYTNWKGVILISKHLVKSINIQFLLHVLVFVHVICKLLLTILGRISFRLLT